MQLSACTLCRYIYIRSVWSYIASKGWSTLYCAVSELLMLCVFSDGGAHTEVDETSWAATTTWRYVDSSTDQLYFKVHYSGGTLHDRSVWGHRPSIATQQLISTSCITNDGYTIVVRWSLLLTGRICLSLCRWRRLLLGNEQPCKLAKRLQHVLSMQSATHAYLTQKFAHLWDQRQYGNLRKSCKLKVLARDLVCSFVPPDHSSGPHRWSRFRLGSSNNTIQWVLQPH